MKSVFNAAIASDCVESGGGGVALFLGKAQTGVSLRVSKDAQTSASLRTMRVTKGA
ncbi:MAG: hypothetical protein LBO72_02465 [Helicobacteraceae bacterium]|nr:hypothetical protein [Helicobacteraceae bacterium]